MHVFQRCLAILMATTLIFAACQKNDIQVRSRPSGLSKTISEYLKDRQATASPYQAKRLQILFDALELSSCRLIKVGATESIICDLKSYRNTRNTRFNHTYYKISFLLRDGKPVFGFIYTVHTNLSRQQLNAGLADILTFSHPSFTGEIVTNSLDDRLLFASSLKNGKLQNTNEIRQKSPKTSGAVNNGQADGEGCLDYYLVTRTYYTDGTVSESWEYLFTSCNSTCGATGQPSNIEMDCPPDTGGSGGGASAVTENVSFESEEIDTGADSTGVSAGGQYLKIRYVHNAIIERHTTSGVVIMVEVLNTVASPLVSPFIDSYGISGSRLLTLLGHNNWYRQLTPPYVMINWFCMVNGRYVSADGRVWTRQWDHIYSAVH